MPPTSIHEIVRVARSNYISGSTKMSKYVSWSMFDVIQRIDAYLNSKHISGPVDSLGRDKPFFNIVTAIRNIWFRATDIDRKDIRFVPKKNTSVILAFVANYILQQWMDEVNFGKFLNQWGLVLAGYGSAVTKWVEKNGVLYPSVPSWMRLIVDQVDFEALPRIEILYKTPAQLQNMATKGHRDYVGFKMDVVNALISAHAQATRKNLNRSQQDNKPNFIELFEVHGLMDARLLEKNPLRELGPDEQPMFLQQMHVIGYIQTDARKGREAYDDFTLYKGREKQDVYQKDDLIEQDGRTLSIGAVENAFESQWMTNHTQKNMKDTLDLASRIIMQTADEQFVGRNVLTAIETGDILVHEENKPLTRVGADNPSITALQSLGKEWQGLAQEITATPESLRGATLPSGTSYQLGKYLGDQASSLFEIMTENKGLALEQMLRRFVIPYIKTKLKHRDQIVAILDDAGIQQIDSVYIPAEAIKRYNENFKKQVLAGEVPGQFNPDEAHAAIKKEMAPLGNQRFFVPDDLDQATWDELFSDFEWDSIQVEIVDENEDKRTVLQTLSTVLQTVASNPNILQNPNVALVFQAILRETGTISPVQMTSAATAPVPLPKVDVRQTMALDKMPPEIVIPALARMGITPAPASPTPPSPETGAQSPPQK